MLQVRTGAIAANTLYKVLVRWDVSNPNVMDVWLNGVKQTTTVGVSGGAFNGTNAVTALAVGQVAKNTLYGANNAAPGTAGATTATIEEFHVITGALSGDETTGDVKAHLDYMTARWGS
jgi:hypothetical protein